MRRRVKVEKKVSTAFSQEAEVGVKWKTQRGWRPSHFRTLGILVGAVIVKDDVDKLADRHVALDEQRRRCVALVVAGHGAVPAGLERQAGQGVVECLDPGLLVDRQHHGMSRRVHAHAEPDDILELVRKLGVTGALEGANAVRLQPLRREDALYRAQRDADRLGHRPAGPVSRLARRFRALQHNHSVYRRGRKRRLARRTGLVAQQTVYVFLEEPKLPAPHRRAADTRAAGDLGDAHPLCRVQDDPSPPDIILRAVLVRDNGFQARAVGGRQKDANFLGHACRLAQPPQFVSPQNA